MITQLLVILFTLTQTLAEKEKDCDGKTNSDNFLVLVVILCTIYFLNYHKFGDQVHEDYEEAVYSSDEDESADDEASEASENSEEEEEINSEEEEEIEDEQTDDGSGDDNTLSEEEVEGTEEAESDGDSSSVVRKRRSSRLGSKDIGHSAQE